ncbi:MAG: LysR family transcriptional regulator [Planctomycetaceae bacterium]
MPQRPAARRPSYKDLTLSQLRSFCQVCRLGGYAAAARELMLTGPTVWEQLKGLEAHFGVELFERHGNRVRPTLHGQRLLEVVRPVLAALESSKGLLQQRNGVLPGQLSIVTNLRVLVEEISRAMSRFRARYPAVQLLVSYARSEEIEPLVVAGDADVTLTLEPGPDEPVSSAIVYEPAGELDYLLVAPPRHPLLRKKVVPLDAIVKYPLVLSRPTGYSRHRVQEVFHRHNLVGSMQIAVQTSSDEYTLACVRAGLGVGIAVGNPRSLLYRGLAVQSLRRWFGTARVGFLWRRGANVPPFQRQLAELLKSSLAQAT